MKCPKCSCADTKVKDTRNVAGVQRRRRRECPECNHRFTTTEIVGNIKSKDVYPLFAPELAKRDGNVVPFAEDKYLESLLRACSRLEVAKADLDELKREIVDKLGDASLHSPVKVKQVIEWTVTGLAELNNLGAMRYALTHMDFESPEEFYTFTKENLDK